MTEYEQRDKIQETGNPYLKILRLDHWIKQFFIFPGCVCALFLAKSGTPSLRKFITGFFSICIIASANYVINEYLDAEFDKYHPVKKYRSLVSQHVNAKIIWLMWTGFTLAGLGISLFVNVPFFFTVLVLWTMGIAYNVKPIRTKDIPVLDVLSESVNNALRLLAGWFIVSGDTLPPLSLIAGYWMGGAFLMGIKRYAEYRMINDPDLAGKYRKSFRFYTERFLLVSSFFYAMSSVFFTGIFLVKYRVELLLFVPAMTGLFCYYFVLSFKNDSAVQKPEKLYHERGLMIYCAILICLFALLMTVDIPALRVFTDSALIKL